MLAAIAREYPRLVAPKADQEMLIWPEPRQLLRNTWENHRALRECEAPVLGVPLRKLRGWMRRWLGYGQDNVPLIVTGHQAELHHPGVWVKNAVIDAAARRIGGAATHFAVDTDAPKHLMYRWPGGGWPMTDDPAMAKARWAGLVRAPERAYVERVREEGRKAAAGWGYEPAWDGFFDALAGRGPADLPGAITRAHQAVDQSLGLHHGAILGSSMWRSVGYGVFVYEICGRADEYAAVYNAALREFRQASGISSPGRPMPDLDVQAERCEIPFWLDDLQEGSRKRACLVREGEVWALECPAGALRFEEGKGDGFAAAERLMAFLGQHRLRLAPRALTLTSFLRLAVVDQFVHGIGGALYDQVTDRILASWYGIEPPTFSVATATMFFPPASQRERTCVQCLSREWRVLRHGLLGERKMELVGRTAAAPRHSAERAMLFSQMHRELGEAQANDSRVAELQERLREARQRYVEDQVLFDRELPYTLQSRERLMEMVERVRGEFE